MPVHRPSRSGPVRYRRVGEALKLARDEIPRKMLDRLAAAAEGRDELRVKTAGEIAGYWMANPAIHQGHELIAAGLLLLAGHVDGDQLIEAIRTGYERGKGSASAGVQTT